MFNTFYKPNVEPKMYLCLPSGRQNRSDKQIVHSKLKRVWCIKYRAWGNYTTHEVKLIPEVTQVLTGQFNDHWQYQVLPSKAGVIRF